MNLDNMIMNGATVENYGNANKDELLKLIAAKADREINEK